MAGSLERLYYMLSRYKKKFKHNLLILETLQNHTYIIGIILFATERRSAWYLWIKWRCWSCCPAIFGLRADVIRDYIILFPMWEFQNEVDSRSRSREFFDLQTKTQLDFLSLCKDPQLPFRAFLSNFVKLLGKLKRNK